MVLSRAHARGVKPEAQSEQKPAAVDEDEALAAQSEFVVLNDQVLCFRSITLYN